MKYLLAFLVPLTALSQNFEPDLTEPRALIIDQDSLHAELSFDPPKGVVYGSLYLTFSAPAGTDSIWLDAMPSIMLTTRPTINGEPIYWDRAEKGIVLRPDAGMNLESALIELNWEACPFKGLFFNGWNDPEGRARRQIFTQGQGIDHRHWLPHVDASNDKLITSLGITFDSDYQVIANGTLLSREAQNNGQTRWHYALEKPHASYLMAIVVGKYHVTTSTTADGILREQYIYPDLTNRYDSTYLYNDLIWNKLNDRIGIDFPWKAYRQIPVANFPHGGMENTTLTIYSDQFVADSRSFADMNYVYVNAHELAHHWFGNLVTVPSSHDFWLHEGFATYYHMYMQGVLFGDDYLAMELEQARRLVKSAYERDNYPILHSKAGSERFYQMGGLILRALETNTGRQTFDRGIRQFLRDNAYGIVTTPDFQSAMEQACSCDLDSFFVQWVEQPDWPGYQGTLNFEEEVGLVHFSWDAFENGDRRPAADSVLIRIWEDTVRYRDYFVRTQGNGEAEFPWNGSAPAFWEVDPGQRYPFEWRCDMSQNQWLKALEFGSIITQYRAAQALRTSKWEALEETYRRILLGDVHHSVADSLYTRWVTASPDDLDELTLDLLERHNTRPFMSVVARRIPSVSKKLIPVFGDMIRNASHNTALKAFFALINNYPEQIPEWLEHADGQEGGMHYDFGVYRAYVTWQVKGQKDPNGYPKLLDYASASYPDQTRILAWEILASKKADEKEWRTQLYRESVSRHRHLRNAAIANVRGLLADKSLRERTLKEMKLEAKNMVAEDIRRLERTFDIELQPE